MNITVFVGPDQPLYTKQRIAALAWSDGYVWPVNP